MIALKILIWALIGYGITQIIADSMIFKPIRESFNTKVKGYRAFWTFEKQFDNVVYMLLKCYICVGFWIGLLLAVFLWSPSLFFFGNKFYFIFDGLLMSCIVWFLKIIEDAIVVE